MDTRESMRKFKQADTFYREGRYAEALTLLDEVNRANPNQKNVLYPAALCLEKLGRPQEALHLCEQLITQHHDPRAQELKARLALREAPGVSELLIPDIDLDFDRPPASVAPAKRPRQSNEDRIWIGWFVLGAMAMFALATLFRYVDVTESYSAMLSALAGPDGQTASVPWGKIVACRLLATEVVSLLCGFAAAFAALRVTGHLLYADFVDNVKEVVRCVVLCHLIMLTCIGIAFIPRFLKSRYDMSVGKLAASIAIYVAVEIALAAVLNPTSFALVTRASGITDEALQSVAIEFDERTDPESTRTRLVGDTAPPLRIATWVKGEGVSLESGKGKNVYVIEFWATWCPPCRQTIPHLSKLQAKYKDKDLVVIGITHEDTSDVTSFVQKMGSDMSYTVAVDTGNETGAAYMGAAGVEGIPHAFIVDRQGKIVWHGHPLGALDKELAKVL